MSKQQEQFFSASDGRVQTEERHLVPWASPPAASYHALQGCDGPECLDTLSLEKRHFGTEISQRKPCERNKIARTEKKYFSSTWEIKAEEQFLYNEGIIFSPCRHVCDKGGNTGTEDIRWNLPASTGKDLLGRKGNSELLQKNNLKNYKQNMLEKNLESVLGRVDLGLGIYH